MKVIIMIVGVAIFVELLHIASALENIADELRKKKK